MKRETVINVWYVLFALLAVLWLRDFWLTSRDTEPVPSANFCGISSKAGFKTSRSAAT
ncbi:MAG: hypothetical protein ACKVQA_25965 [Burkholderiales bacterium]